MVVECDIILDSNPDCIIRCGETIHGKLIVRSASSLAAKGLFVKLKGKGRVRYERLGDELFGYEEYVTPEEYVSGNQSHLSVGENEFKFQLAVPEGFPPTFAYAQSMGYIFYKVTAYLDNQGCQKSIEKLPVTVHGKLDLRHDPVYRMPICVKGEKDFFFSEHGLELQISLLKSGFAIGQSIPFSILVRNDSTIDCYDSKIYLVQYFDYINNRGTPRPITRNNVVLGKHLGPILKHSNKKFDDSIHIPMNVCITTHNKSKVINIYYKLRFVAITKGPHFNGQLECPVTVGSIPLDEGCEEVKS